MNANDSLERGIVDAYEREAPKRAPDWVLASALETIESTPQRRALIPAPWRFRNMNTFAKWAIAVVAVLVIGAVGWSVIGPRSSSSVGGQPPATLSPSPSPSPSPDASAPPPLSSRFTSTVHGISLAYPTGWKVAPATEPWRDDIWNFHTTNVDRLYDPTLEDHLFLVTASRPLAGATGATWVTDFLAGPEGCQTPTEPITIDGAEGRTCEGVAALSAGDRGYFIRLYSSDDEAWLATSYGKTWFRSVLDTVQLDPGSAVDTAPSVSPKASPST
jgi:hypothetical protein